MNKMKPLKQDRSAVVSVVIALLLLGLFAVTLTTIQIVYVPRWVEQQEGFHMHDVAAQFADIKHAIDIQTISKDKTPISTPLTLGTGQQSFLTSSRAYGSVHVDSNSIIFSMSNISNQYTISLGTFYYTSRNNYYVDQSYILEAGAVIINQSEGNIMSTNPPVIYHHPVFDLTYTFFNITERGGKTDIGGYGTYLIQTNYSHGITYNLTNITNLQIISSYPNCWYNLVNTTLQDLGFIYKLDYDISISDNIVDIIVASAAHLDISMNIVKIFAQISPGRIG
jgi:hypothetical protein